MIDHVTFYNKLVNSYIYYHFSKSLRLPIKYFRDASIDVSLSQEYIEKF